MDVIKFVSTFGLSVLRPLIRWLPSVITKLALLPTFGNVYLKADAGLLWAMVKIILTPPNYKNIQS